jgi:hypothetical protein
MGGGLLLGAAGMALLARLDADSGYLLDTLPSLVMIGFGMGLVLPQALNLSTFGVRPQEIGVASAMFNVAQQAGASLDTALLNTLAASAAAGYGAGQVANQVHGYNMASLGSAVILLVAAVVAVVVINTRLTDTAQPVPGVPEGVPA